MNAQRLKRRAPSYLQMRRSGEPGEDYLAHCAVHIPPSVPQLSQTHASWRFRFFWRRLLGRLRVLNHSLLVFTSKVRTLRIGVGRLLGRFHECERQRLATSFSADARRRRQRSVRSLIICRDGWFELTKLHFPLHQSCYRNRSSYAYDESCKVSKQTIWSGIHRGKSH